MPRPLAAVPNIFTPSGAPTLPELDADFAAVLSNYNDSAIGYVNYAVDTGIANAYVATLAAAPSAYIAGMMLALKIANSNTAASNINVNSIGVVPILNSAGNALLGGELPVGVTVPMIFNGTGFCIIGETPIYASFSGTTNQTLICDGASSIFFNYAFSSAATATLTLTRLRNGIPVTIIVSGAGSGSSTLFIAGTLPNGSSFTPSYVVQGVSGAQSGIVASAGQVWVGNGSLGVASLWMAFQHS